jgi:multiple RNA-binding domain-containing protein 1
VAAYEALDRKSFQGRLLHLLAAVDRRGKLDSEDGRPRTVKDEKNAKRKAAANKDFNWSMLYMNASVIYPPFVLMN